ncbi:hypothetical protein DBR17_04970 [Sphingomonas sp. HMWF008]|nr:hypothetical protein DBR17_04970 [Sphingomonas sp. HMWF008]
MPAIGGIKGTNGAPARIASPCSRNHGIAYGDEQAIADLVPHMLAAFLASDRGFAKARDGLERRK